MIEIKIEGIKEIEQALRQFPEKLQKKYMKDAVKAGAQVIANSAKLRTPVSMLGQRFGKHKHPPGTLKAAIKVYAAKRSELKKRAAKYWGIPIGQLTKENLLSSYGVFVNRRAPKDAYYWFMVEGGHRTRGKTKVPAKKFMPPAFQENEHRVINMISAKLNMALQNARTTL